MGWSSGALGEYNSNPPLLNEFDLCSTFSWLLGLVPISSISTFRGPFAKYLGCESSCWWFVQDVGKAFGGALVSLLFDGTCFISEVL